MLTVAVAITLELRSATAFFHVLDTGVTLRNVSTVQAFAFFTVTVIFGTTTIATIPSTTSVVAVQNKIGDGFINSRKIVAQVRFQVIYKGKENTVMRTYLLSSQLPSPFQFGEPQPFLIDLVHLSPFDTKVQSRHWM